MIDPIAFRRQLLRWYARHKRDLPWRKTTDPYRVWVSEIMLQQTRVAAVIPYYERFLARFPNPQVLAEAHEADLLAAWAGLGYYSRARNLQKAAMRITEMGAFPSSLDAIRELAGIGEYTAAAVGSIAFGLREPSLDGNVIRVLSRLAAEPGEVTAQIVRSRLQQVAKELLDPEHPGDFNQALMELGATICLPAQPRCLLCPVAEHCEARGQGRQHEYPVRRPKPSGTDVEQRLLLIRRGGAYLFWQRPPESRRMAGFWELPEARQFPKARLGEVIGGFRHTIVNTKYRFELARASLKESVAGYSWLTETGRKQIPLSTVATKALALLEK